MKTRKPELGQHFTPPEVASFLMDEALADWAHAGPLDVLDPACGDGSLLRAFLKKAGPDHTMRGIDIDPDAAAEARKALPGANIRVGDSLSMAASHQLRPESMDLILLNPPYLGEKGRKSLFQGVAALGPTWASRTCARMDYLYYFLHLALDLLKPGGRAMALTTAYWPTATSAAILREDLQRRARWLSWVSFGPRSLFENATGQSNLAVVFEKNENPHKDKHYRWCQARFSRRKSSLSVEEKGEGRAPADHRAWNPFVDKETLAWIATTENEWTPLSDLVEDRQGVVSGCDRVTKNHRRAIGETCPPEKSPVFVLTGQEVLEKGWHRNEAVKPFLEPILRGSEFSPGEVITDRKPPTDPAGLVMLYLHRNGPRPPEEVLEHLRPMRAVLERRREVQEGKLPWWALHWPRDLAKMRAPKLVTARRGATMKFALDLAGHVVSSDCTFLSPLSGDVQDLRELLDLLHLPEVARLMRLTGKQKGSLMEFYSEPLRRLRVPWER